jgi:hypothetical protein
MVVVATLDYNYEWMVVVATLDYNYVHASMIAHYLAKEYCKTREYWYG